MQLLGLVLRVIASRWRLFLLFGVLFLAFGEIWFRLPFLPQRLEYAPDPEFSAVLAPNQAGFMWLGNLSFPSETITLNAQGWRGPMPEPGRFVIAAVGDSEGLGVGVKDEEVWTAVLAEELDRSHPGRTQVVNACQPGHGPQMHARMLRRIIARSRADLFIVRVSLQDRHFLPVRDERIAANFAAAKQREELRQITRFLPHLVSKLEAQREGFERAFTLPWRRDKESKAFRGYDAASGRAMWAQAGPSWREAKDAARAAGARILFLIYDPMDSPGCAILEEELRTLCGDDAGAKVLRWMPEHFELDHLPTEAERRRVLQRDLVLARDPHANARQHALKGRATHALLRASGLLDIAPR